MTNDVTPSAKYSNPFQMSVTAIVCSNHQTTSAISTPLSFEVPSVLTSTYTQFLLGTSYSTNSAASFCTPTYQLRYQLSGWSYSGTMVQIVSSTGVLSVDKEFVRSEDLFVRITMGGSTINTNSFKISVVCSTVTMSAIATTFSYIVPSTPAVGTTTIVVRSSYASSVSAVSICPLTYSLWTASGSYSGSFLSFSTTTGTLTITTNTVGSETVYIKV